MSEIKSFEIEEKYLKKFNWGACILGWIWGLFNKSYITLVQIPVSLIPVVGPFFSIVCAIWFGIKGNAWAYKNVNYADFEDFNKSQRKFAIAGLIVALLNLFTFLISLPIFNKINTFAQAPINFSNQLFFANKSIELLVIFNIIMTLFVYVWLLKTSKKVKYGLNILVSLFFVYFLFSPVLEIVAQKKYENKNYASSIKCFEILEKSSSIYFWKQNPEYKDKLVYLYLMQEDLKQAIYWAEMAEKEEIQYPIEENQLTSLYIFNNDNQKAIERGAQYKIDLMNGNWNNAISELNKKIDNPKGGTVLDGKVYANYKFYLARAIAYKNLNNNEKAQKDFQIVIKLNDSPDVKLAFYNYKTYYNKPKFLD